MISIPDSLSFAKLMMMSSAPAKSAGMPDTRPEIHSFLDCPIQSQLQTQLGVLSFYSAENFENEEFDVFYLATYKVQRNSTLV